MPHSVKTRRYRSPTRSAQAEGTRQAVLEAARTLFLSRGYTATTARQIAAAANVSVDTVYAAVGRKPEVMLALIESAIGGQQQAVAASDRRYVQQVRAASSAVQKIDTYATALSELLPRLAPLVLVLREASAIDRRCAKVWQDIADRRAANMRLFAADLRSTGELRSDLTDDEVAEFVWSTNAPEYYQLLADRGWSAQQYKKLVADVWTRVLLGP